MAPTHHSPKSHIKARRTPHELIKRVQVWDRGAASAGKRKNFRRKDGQKSKRRPDIRSKAQSESQNAKSGTTHPSK